MVIVKMYVCLIGLFVCLFVFFLCVYSVIVLRYERERNRGRKKIRRRRGKEI